MNPIVKWLRVICLIGAAGSASAQSPVTITTGSPLPAATVQVVYSQQLNANGGKPPYSWVVNSDIGSPPPGLNLSPSGVVNGTPTRAGVFSFGVIVYDTQQQSASKTFSITVQPSQPTITNSSPLPNASVGVAYSYGFTATGGSPPYVNWAVVSGNLPPGLSPISSSGQITGTPTTAGQYNFTVAVTDTAKQVGQKQFSLTVQASFTITSISPLPNGAVGVAYSFNFAASGGSPPYNWTASAGSLPPGLTLSNAGALTGTPTNTGLFTFTIQVSDSPLQAIAAQVTTAVFTLRITQPLTVTTPTPISATVGSNLTVVMTNSGGTPPYVWMFANGSQPPPGFNLDTISGFLSGTPTTPGMYNFTVQVTDYVGATATKALVMVEQPAIVITNASPVVNGATGAAYSLTFAATGGSPPLTWTVDSGAVPAGLTLDPASGILSGTPLATGTFSFVIRATDSVKATVTKSFSLTIGQQGPGAQLSQSNLDFSAQSGGATPAAQNIDVVAPQALQFTIQTDGGAAGTPTPAWLFVLLLKGSTPARIPVAVNQAGLTAGKYAARILVNTADGRQFIVTANLTVSVADQQLDVEPQYLRFYGTAEEDLLVANAGGGGLLAFQVSVVGDAPWLMVTPAAGRADPNAPAVVRVIVSAGGLPAGSRRAVIHIDSAAGSADIPVTLLVRDPGPAIGTDLQGAYFKARQGNGDSNSETVNVLNLGDGVLNWKAEIVSGAEWLSMDVASGRSTPNAPSALKLTSNPDALAVGPYYALVKLSDSGSGNSSVFLMAILEINGADTSPVVQPVPEGLFFVGKAGSLPPPAQVESVYVSSTTPVSFQVSASTSDGGNWLTVSPSSGVTSTGQTAKVSVTANPLTLKAGIYTGEVTYALSDTSARSANVTMVVQPFTVGVASAKARDAVPGCTPAKLALVETGLVNSFATPAGWPQSLSVQLADDCGSPVTNGQVVATFSNGDPAVTMNLTDPNLAVYSATWSPGKVSGSMTVTAHAVAPSLAAATANITGSVIPNKAPVLAANGVLSNLNPQVGAPLAPGTMSQVRGSNLATADVAPGVVPLPATFNGTQVLVGAFVAPLYTLSDGLLNVQLPTELQPGKEYPVVVSANGGFTLPDIVTTTAAQPSVAVGAGNLLIAQHAADFTLVTANSPAVRGETIIIYLVGMGATDQTVVSGLPAPSFPLANALVQPVVTVGGQQAAIIFAGLTPGAVGLYQIDLTVPTSAPPGDASVVISQNGAASNAAVLPVR